MRRGRFGYFMSRGVGIKKVISEDSPLTVAKVAERAGIRGAEKYIDCTKVDE